MVMCRHRHFLKPKRRWILACVILPALYYTFNASLLYTISNDRLADINQSIKSINTTCSPKENIAYVKMIKCASETISAILRSYGLRHNLTFVLPHSKKVYLGWPYQMDSIYYQKSATGTYNILCDHSVFNETIFTGLMPRHTVYITSLRQPFSQVKSMFSYYNLANLSGISSDFSAAFKEYFLRYDYYESRYKSHDAASRRYCIPDGFSMTKNLMSFNLGFPTGSFDESVDYSRNGTLVSQWLDGLVRRFDLVMLVEYIVESLVLLKRLMCWSWKDILFIHLNKGTYKGLAEAKVSTDAKLVDEESLELIYRNISGLDYQLYDRFKTILLGKINSHGTDFLEEVVQLNHTLSAVAQYCRDAAVGTSQLTPLQVTTNRWTAGFTISPHECSLIKDPAKVRDIQQARQEEQVLVLPIGTKYNSLC